MSTPPEAPIPVLQDVEQSDSYYFACGGMADLYEGQWTRRPGEIIPVAIKLIRRYTWNDKVASERARKLFLRESRLWSQLCHPNIVPFYGMIFERDYPGLVMPYYRNGDLVHFLQKHPQSDSDKLNLVCEVAAGLEYLHNLKPHAVIHGDIKASNVLVTDDHQACLTDFGVARMLGVSGYTTDFGGTLRWMAPELLDDCQPSPTTASDIWAFAMTVLEILTGKKPFEHMRTDATVVLSLGRGFLPKQPPEIGDSTWVLLERCWAFEPSKRPAASTVSIILNIVASLDVMLTAGNVNGLVDYLEAERQRLGDSHNESESSEDVEDPFPILKEQKKISLSFHIPQPSLDRYIPSHTASSRPRAFSLPTQWRRFSDENMSDPPAVKITNSRAAFYCCWPECGAYFVILQSRRAHEVQHWLAWKRQSEDDTQSRADTMPAIASVVDLLGNSSQD